MVDFKSLSEQIKENTELINRAIDILDGPDIPPVVIPPEVIDSLWFGDDFNLDDFR